MNKLIAVIAVAVAGCAFSATQTSKEYVDARDEEVMAAVVNHTEDLQNPHSVTAEQVGAYTKDEADDKFVDEEIDPTVPSWAKESIPPTAKIESVNGQTGVVVLVANHVGAYSKSETDQKIAASKPGNYSIVSNRAMNAVLEETDPNVPEWAKRVNKPTYSAAEVGARADDWLPGLEEINAQKKLVSGSNIKTVNGQSLLGSGNIEIQGGISARLATNISECVTRRYDETNLTARIAAAAASGPVSSVNGKTGEVRLDIRDAVEMGAALGADPDGQHPGFVGNYVFVYSGMKWGVDYAANANEATYCKEAEFARTLDAYPAAIPGTKYAKVVNDRIVLVNRTAHSTNEVAFVGDVKGAARPLPPYLHEISFDSSYPEDAEWYYAHADDIAGGCSVRRVGNIIERNYDWPLDYAAEFVIRISPGVNRYGSVGVATVGANLTEEIVTSGKWSRYYKCLPGRTLDGINECGVMAEINVVATNGAPWETQGDRDINAIGGVRWVLDHAASAGEAASNLAERVYIPASMTSRGYSCHFAICDAAETWIVEDGVAERVAAGVPPVMTNFRLLTPDPTGSGYERYAVLTNAANSITNVWWTNAYVPTATPWVSDIGANTGHVWEVWASADRETHRREGKWWQSVHTSVYDLDAKTLKIAVQETADWYEFALATGDAKPLAGRVFMLSTVEQRIHALNAVIEALGGMVITPEPSVPIREQVREAIIGLDPDATTFYGLADALMRRGVLFERPATAMELGQMIDAPASVTNVTSFFDYYLTPPNAAK